jgi:hypothetical protein
MPAFLSERIMSISQAISDDFDLMVALLSTETKSSTSAMSKWSKCRVSARRFCVTGIVGVNSRNSSACIRA